MFFNISNKTKQTKNQENENKLCFSEKSLITKTNPTTKENMY